MFLTLIIKNFFRLKKSIFREENMMYCIQIYFPQGIGKIDVIIFDYIMIKNGKVVEKKPVPNKLKEKFEKCKRKIEIDFNFLKNYRFIDGEALGIHSPWMIWKPAIRIVRSENKISCSNYETIIYERL